MKRYRLRIPGPCGKIELAALDPCAPRTGIALIAHPHPLYGGSLENKVVDTLARFMAEKLGYVAVRLNFRGVGASSGHYDAGNGEVEDILATAAFVQKQYPVLPLLLAGFSFGAYVQSRAFPCLDAAGLVLVAPAVTLFPFGEIPAQTSIIHGTEDEVVPYSSVESWAHSQGATVLPVNGADHFFHRRLAQLQRVLALSLPTTAPCAIRTGRATPSRFPPVTH
jgi:uncharacterized protein